MDKDQKMLEWMKAGVALAKERNYTPQMMGWMAYSAALIELEENIPLQTDNFEVQKAFAALKILNDYLENECSFSNCTTWEDQQGYSFETDMGYLWEGLEGLEECLIKRLRKASVEDKQHD